MSHRLLETSLFRVIVGILLTLIVGGGAESCLSRRNIQIPDFRTIGGFQDIMFDGRLKVTLDSLHFDCTEPSGSSFGYISEFTLANLARTTIVADFIAVDFSASNHYGSFFRNYIYLMGDSSSTRDSAKEKRTPWRLLEDQIFRVSAFGHFYNAADHRTIRISVFRNDSIVAGPFVFKDPSVDSIALVNRSDVLSASSSLTKESDMDIDLAPGLIEITDSSISCYELMNLPRHVIEEITNMKGNIYLNKEVFLQYVEQLLGQRFTRMYKAKILKHVWIRPTTFGELTRATLDSVIMPLPESTTDYNGVKRMVDQKTGGLLESKDYTNLVSVYNRKELEDSLPVKYRDKLVESNALIAKFSDSQVRYVFSAVLRFEGVKGETVRTWVGCFDSYTISEESGGEPREAHFLIDEKLHYLTMHLNNKDREQIGWIKFHCADTSVEVVSSGIFSAGRMTYGPEYCTFVKDFRHNDLYLEDRFRSNLAASHACPIRTRYHLFPYGHLTLEGISALRNMDDKQSRHYLLEQYRAKPISAEVWHYEALVDSAFNVFYPTDYLIRSELPSYIETYYFGDTGVLVR